LNLKEPRISSSSETPEVEGPENPVPELSQRTVKELVQVFKLLSDETRLRILLLLVRQREMHVRALCDQLGQSQPAVSHHLALLRVAGLIEPRREGKHNFYSILPARFQELLKMVFATVPENQLGQIRFEDYTLKYDPDTETDLNAQP